MNLPAKSDYDYSAIDNPQLEAKLRVHEEKITFAAKRALRGAIEVAQSVRDARNMFRENAVSEKEFQRWISFCCGISPNRAHAYCIAADLLDEFPGYEDYFGLSSLQTLGSLTARRLPGVKDEIQKRLDRKEKIGTKEAKEIIANAKKTVKWPPEVCNEAQQLILSDIGRFDYDQELVVQLGEYDDEVQVELCESVLHDVQTFEQAVATGEVPFTTPEEACRLENEKIEAACRALMKLFNKSVPKSVLLDNQTIESARGAIRNAQATLKMAKGKVCPRSDGLSDSCKACNGIGRVTSARHSQLKLK